MRLPRSLVLLSFVLPCVLAAAPLVQSATQAVAIPEGIPVRWGLVLDCDRPFLSVGSTLHARYVLANGSQLDVADWCPVSGGNGCSYSFTLHDSADRIVWQPGSLVGGVFSGPGCFYGSVRQLLPAKSALQGTASVPLIYQNAAGFGPQGQPLPPGFYVLVVDVWLSGPEHPPSTFAPGATYSARLPIQIE